MIWSKKKKALEALLAASVKKRVQYHVTRYGPGLSYHMTRAWITWDGEEIAQMSTIGYMLFAGELAYDIRTMNHCMDFRDPQQREGYYLAYKEAATIARRQEIFPRDDFDDALREYLAASIDGALVSDDPLVRAFAMFDRRLGKRRLRQFAPEADHVMVWRFYALRCAAEGLQAAPAPQ